MKLFPAPLHLLVRGATYMVGVHWKPFQPGRLAVTEVQLRTAFAAALSPIAVLAGTLALWRLGADLSWMSNFPVQKGPFSQWLVWMGLAIVLRLAASKVERGAGARS
jgi:hypothetical protein